MIAGLSYTILGIIGAFALLIATSGPDARQLPTGEPPEESEIARLHAIRDRTAAVRGLPAASDVQEGYLSREDLGAYVEELYSRLDREALGPLETLNTVMRMLRMIGPRDDLIELGADSTASGLAGFYDYEQKRLVVISDLTGGANEEATLAHEYTHALQDLRFDLEDFLFSGRWDEDGEYDRTLTCVVEGDASVSQVQYLEDVYGEDWLTVVLADFEKLEEEFVQLFIAQAAIPPAVQRYTAFNYNECARFVFEVWQEGGWEAVDALYEDPPSTTEQVMHPERYFARETALPLDLEDFGTSLGLGWRLATEATFGEFDVYNYVVSSGYSPIAAFSATEGWGAGRMHIYSLGGGDRMQVVLHIGLLWDSTVDLKQFKVAFESVLDGFNYESRREDEDVWHWDDRGEYGTALWDEDNDRVDLVYATDEAALQRAVEALQTP